MKYLLLIILSSCAVFKQDPTVPAKIKEQKLAGRWENSQGQFTIWCEGQFEYHEPQKWDNMRPKHSEKGGYIKKIDGYSFKTGPIFGETHDINRLPYLNEKGRLMMDMNGKAWNNVESFNCEAKN